MAFDIACTPICWYLSVVIGAGPAIHPTVKYPERVYCEISAHEFRVRTLLEMKLHHTGRYFLVWCDPAVPPPYVPVG